MNVLFYSRCGNSMLPCCDQTCWLAKACKIFSLSLDVTNVFLFFFCLDQYIPCNHLQIIIVVILYNATLDLISFTVNLSLHKYVVLYADIALTPVTKTGTSAAKKKKNADEDTSSTEDLLHPVLQYCCFRKVRTATHRTGERFHQLCTTNWNASFWGSARSRAQFN